MKRESSKGLRLWLKRCKRFYEQRGRCCWCNQPMRLVFGHIAPQPDDLATLEHLDDRMSEERGTHVWKVRVVLSCRKCNNARGKQRQAQRMDAQIGKAALA